MSIKKKSGIRAKLAKRTTISSKIAEFKQEQVHENEFQGNPLLKLLTTTKKEKQLAKSTQFNEKILSKVTFNMSGGVSKSALRRRKRKEREQLKPKMDDLLLSLPERVNVVESKQKKKEKHTGHTKLLEAENKRFNQVLNNSQFKKTPFALLQQAINQNMGN
ncbi:CIC11C00000003606 [Sungouiella intermedia]|uniref:Ribosome biogenesis protein SLX9 n=1 Tax=Sungouiella intermedia TaxID=45354 RepID=A0A1L0D7U3_9ASCO|nr:CIC11C00000003606 [[Candida] intermedia]